MRSPVPYYGGKYYMIKHMIPLFPKHYVYVSGCGGGAQDLFCKEPSLIEVYNDINSDLVNFFRVLRDRKKADELRFMLSLTPYSREEFDDCQNFSTEINDIERARKFYVRLKQSFNYSFGSWNCVTTADRMKMSKPVCSFLSEIDGNIPKAVERLRTVVIENMDIVELLKYKKYSKDGVFIYLDPPYIHETRVAPNVYAMEMNNDKHNDLVEAMLDSKSKIMLSGYDHEIYDPLVERGWSKISIGEFSKRASLSKDGSTKSRGKEVLWINYEV